MLHNLQCSCEVQGLHNLQCSWCNGSLCLTDLDREGDAVFEDVIIVQWHSDVIVILYHLILSAFTKTCHRGGLADY